MTKTEHESDFKLTKDTPYFAHMGELWGVYCEDFKGDIDLVYRA